MAGKIKLKPEFADQFKKLLDCNNPDKADESFKNSIKELANNKDNKLEHILVHNVIPKNLETWLKKYAKQKEFTVSFFGNGYRYDVVTQKSREAAEKVRQSSNEFWANWINSPG